MVVTRIGLAALLLVGPLFVGCTTGGLEEVRIPEPEIGASVVYETVAGERLTVNVTDTGDRKDHRGVQHEALVVTADLVTQRYGGQEETLRFREASDLAQGLVVHHVAACGRPLLEEAGCYDNRSAVGFSSSGLPGGLAMGPLWGSTLPEDAVNVTLYPDAGSGEVQYDVSRHPGESDCRRIDVPDEAVRDTDFPLEVTEATVCDGEAFPIRFGEASGARYERVEASAGGGSVEGADASSWTERGQAVDRRKWSAPLAVHDSSDPANLSALEAHQVAVNRSDAYRGFFDANPEAVVLGSEYSTSGHASTRVVEETYQRWYERQLLAVAPDGQARAISVEERETAGAMSDYEVSSIERETLGRGTSTAQIPDRLIALGSALGLGDELVGTPRQGFHAAWLAVPQHPYLFQNHTPYPDGFVFFAMYDEADMQQGGGLAIQKPWYLVANGVTGNLMLFETHRANLPFS